MGESAQFKAGPGRPRGSVNVASLEKRQLMKYLKEEGADRFLECLARLDDDRFLDKYLQLIEFAFPKQSRVVNEHTGKDGKELFTPLTEDQKSRLVMLWSKSSDKG